MLDGAFLMGGARLVAFKGLGNVFMRQFRCLVSAAIAAGIGAIWASAPVAAAPLPDAVSIEVFAMLPEVEGA